MYRANGARIDRRRAQLSTLRVPSLLLAAVLLSACAVQPQPLNVGSDECAQCLMSISEAQYATQLLTNRGRSHMFDSVECLHAFLEAGRVPDDELHSTWVASFDEPELWVPAEDAAYVRSSMLRSPMGGGLSAHASLADAEQMAAAVDGTVMDWNGVRDLLRQLGAHPHAH
jgi:copper chaperone NosL